MEIKIIIDDDEQLELAFFGKLDTLGAGEIETKVYALLNNVKKSVYFDFAGVTYLSSMGVRLLISSQRLVKRSENSLIIINPTDAVRQILEMIKLDELMG
ncbi:MAG: STAS domain-containing protein [Bacteroidota bacterium]